jgi:hypothetical protein
MITPASPETAPGRSFNIISDPSLSDSESDRHSDQHASSDRDTGNLMTAARSDSTVPGESTVDSAGESPAQPRAGGAGPAPAGPAREQPRPRSRFRAVASSSLSIRGEMFSTT